MTADTQQPRRHPAPDRLAARFLLLLPRIETHARISFADVACPATRADHVAETVALAWRWYVRLAQRGKDANDFPAAFAGRAAQAVRSGRRLCGQERAKDVLSPSARRRHGFAVEALPARTAAPVVELYARPGGQEAQDAFEERLRDNTVTPVPAQVAFRLDWPAFKRTLGRRDRALLDYLALGHGATGAARRFGLSVGRVSQLRGAWCRAWRRFQCVGVAQPGRDRS